MNSSREPNHKTKTELINWRLNKVIELKSQGYNQEEIAQILQVTPALISYDLRYLRDEAKQNVHEYTTRLYPLQFKISLIAFQNILKEYWNISQKTTDNKEKMQALEHYRQANMDMMTMIQNGGFSMEQSMAREKRNNNNQNQNQNQNQYSNVKAPYVYQGATIT